MSNQTMKTWHMNRMGLVDFWYYADDEMSFEDGHMMLRGSNGSGKSVTMQSFIPLLLDGNKSSERLDPFGSRARKMENYLLVDGDPRTDRIGYLWLEFKRENSEAYKTIGMGLRARKGKPLDSWYFVIENNLRVNKDFSFLDGKKLAITKLQLRNIIGDQALFDTQKAYMKKVNDALFGFKSLEDYKEIINLLVQLRSPKLSNSLRPTIINELLSNALPGLDEDDLRPMSEAITNMDNIKDQLDRLQLSAEAADKIDHAYDQYICSVLFDRFEAFRRCDTQCKDLKKQQKKLQTSIELAQKAITSNQDALETTLDENALLQEKRDSLNAGDALALTKEIAALKQTIQETQNTCTSKEKETKNKEDRYFSNKQKLEKEENRCFQIEQDILEDVDTLDQLQDTVCFEEHAVLSSHLKEQMTMEYVYEDVQKNLRAKIQKIDFALDKIQQIEHLSRDLQQEKNRADQIQMIMEDLEKEIEQKEEVYRKTIEWYLSQFADTNQGNQHLKLSSEDLFAINDLLYEYETTHNYQGIGNLLAHAYDTAHKKYTIKSIETKNALHQVKEKIEELEQELHHWKTLQDPTPPLTPSMEANRKDLDHLGIAYKALYDILEFAPDTPQSSKDAFEEILSRLGLLNALFVDQKEEKRLSSLRKDLHDQYLFVSKPIHSISSYTLKGSQTKEMVESLNAFFHQLGIEQYRSLVLDASLYRTGLITGSIDGSYTSSYIGKQAREIYRKKQIEALTLERDELEIQEIEIRQQFETIQQHLIDLDQERERFPKEDTLKESLVDIEDTQHNWHRHQNDLEAKKATIAQLSQQIQGIKSECQPFVQEFDLPLQPEAFRSLKEDYGNYQSIVAQIQLKHQSYISAQETCTFLQASQDDLTSDLDTLRYEVKKARHTIALNQSLLTQKEELLAETGQQDVVEQLSQIEKTLQENAIRIDDLKKQITQDQTSITFYQENESSIEKNIEESKQQLQAYENNVQRLIQNAYFQFDGENVYDTAKEILELKESCHLTKDISEYMQIAQATLQENRGLLVDYNPTNHNDEKDTMGIILRFSARYRNEEISFKELIEKLEQDIDIQQTLLSDSDRQLFEEVLVDILSKKVRGYIQDAKHWLDTINRYMAQTDTSSNLKIALQWKPLKAETEDELDTKKLVNILEKDTAILKTEDLQDLSKHFRKKIERARRIAASDSVNTLSFHQLMKEMMDYRTWYAFTIMTSKGDGPMKELSNNTFLVYSGGEKAMCMYVPLFSAVAARYSDAREDCPMIIALDEAFAGVDTKNMDAMFKLISDFQFDYIMNSQVLWGDSKYVSALAIYELIRDGNSPYINKISYLWNGSVKKLMS